MRQLRDLLGVSPVETIRIDVEGRTESMVRFLPAAPLAPLRFLTLLRARFATLEHQDLVSIRTLAFKYYKNKSHFFRMLATVASI